MVRDAVGRAGNVMGSVGLLTLCLLAGCDNVPTWEELTTQKQPETPPVTPAVTPQPPPPAVQPSPPKAPPKPSIDEILAKFHELLPNQVDDNAIRMLTSVDEGIEQITDIDATYSGVTNEGLATLSKLTSLRTLKLDGTRVDDKGCEAIGRVPTLEELTLPGGKITDEGMRYLKDLTHLKFLTLANTQMSLDGFEVIGQLPSLETINVEGSPLDDRSMKALCQAKTLQSLNISRTQVTDDGLEYLSNLDNLVSLSMAYCNVTCGNLGKVVQKSKKMKLMHLDVASTGLNDRGVAAIGAIDSLKSLSLWRLSGMTDNHFKVIVSGKKDLVWLQMGVNLGLTNNALAALKGSKNLEFLDVGEIKGITDAGLEHLTKLKNLRRLVYGGSGVTPAGVENLRKSIPELNNARPGGDQQKKVK